MNRPQWFQARCGRRPTFQSPGDALAYDAGFQRFPLALPVFTPPSPLLTGWRDAESAHRDVRQRAAFEAADEMADWAFANREKCWAHA